MAAGESYTVEQGDTLISIAKKKDFRSWEAIWNDDANKELRAKRPDPQVLAPGDVVVIPPRKPKEFVVDTGKKHQFKVKTLKAKFRTTVHDENGKPLGGKRFKLEIAGKSLEGRTGGDGVIELDVDPAPATGTLTVWMGTDPEKELNFKLNLGNLDPIDLPTGVQARLNNLGYLSGKDIDGQTDDDLKSALTQFQLVHGLDPTGEADDATKQKLVELHDRR